MRSSVEPFTNPLMVAGYTERPPKQVPGFSDLHRMAVLLLAEHAPRDGRILVLGAGGGLELKAFAEAEPEWRLMGVDPSAEMLALARTTLGANAARVELLQGYADDAPAGPFDGATCFLTLHFLDRETRLRTLVALRERMAIGARLVVAHHSFPTSDGQVDLWSSRYAAFAGVPSAAGLATLPILSPDEEEALLREAGFSDVALFYAGFTFRGWVATRRD